MNKKILFITSSIVLLTLLITGVSFAYLTSQSQVKNNEFVPGVLTATIEEVIEVEDDTTTKKEVTVQNAANPHEVDAYIRVMLVPSFRTETGTLAGNISLNPSGNAVSITAPNGKTITLTLASDWNTNWFFDNGYFYHRAIVTPGNSTAILLQRVTAGESELWDTFQLEVLSDAIQAENGAANIAWDGVSISTTGELQPGN